jgi:hypothetical protein
LTIEIWTKEDLNNIRYNIEVYYIEALDRYTNFIVGDYIQMADIDLQGTSWDPIGYMAWAFGGGTGPPDSIYFTGNYNGNGYKISNLYISKISGEPYDGIGLFSVLGPGASITNLTLLNIDVTGQWFVGGIAGYLDSPSAHGTTFIHQCYVQGTVKSIWTHPGMLGGRWDGVGTISECAGVGYVRDGDPDWGWAGGLVGDVSAMSFSNCYFYGTVEAEQGSGIGGISGNTHWTQADKCYSAANIIIRSSAGGGFEGGFVGTAYMNSASFTNSYFDRDLAQMGNWVHPDGIWPHSSPPGNVKAKSTVEMKHKSTYQGWDFETIWAIHPDIQDGYPILRRLYEQLSSFTLPEWWNDWNWNEWLNWNDWDFEWYPELINISVVPGFITPSFTKGQLYYNVHVNREVKVVKVTPWATCSEMIIKVNGKSTKSGIGVYIPIKSEQTQVHVETPDFGVE